MQEENLRPILRVLRKKARKTSLHQVTKEEQQVIEVLERDLEKKLDDDYPENSQLFPASMSPQRQAWSHIERDVGVLRLPLESWTGL